MKIRRQYFLTALVLFFMFAEQAPGCSVSFLEAGGQALAARNMDWPEPDGRVIKNVRGIEKTAMMPPEGAIPYTWTSAYGSITFDMLAQVPGIGIINAPGCGLNEKGFYAAALFVDPPEYPGPGGKPAVRCGEVVRVLLDTCASVPEALEKFNDFGVTELSISGVNFRLHWFLADRNGNCAIVEFPPENHGVISVHTPPQYGTMTNSYYDPSYAGLALYEGFGGSLPIPPEDAVRTSMVRFVRNTWFSLEAMAGETVEKDDGFFVMDKVKQTEGTTGSQSRTDWTIVYDLKKPDLAWTAIKNNSRRTIDLRRLDFNFSPEVYSMDIQSPGAGDVTTAFGEKSGGGCRAGFTSSWSLFLVVPAPLAALRGK